jgi:hypothetical protein
MVRADMAWNVALRERLKAALPKSARKVLINARAILSAPPLEDIVLHDYKPFADPSIQPRLNLVIPTVNPALAFGGVTTGIEIFILLGMRCGADMRIILDDLDKHPDESVVRKMEERADLAPKKVEIVARKNFEPEIGVRAADVFIAFNWWTAFNIQPLVEFQTLLAGVRLPYLYIYQEFEPGFYPYSSTHLLAWQATRGMGEWWAIYNSSQLASFVKALGAEPSRSFVVEPHLPQALKSYISAPRPPKRRRILVYGRPGIQRNCYPMLLKGLARWAETYPAASTWEVVSAGTLHAPERLAKGIKLRSLGKLSLPEYAELLSQSAIGVSLMCSPHPSYPPLEMAHFGLMTITNSYSFKDLSGVHDNIVSLSDTSPDALAQTLAQLCDTFAADPLIGIRGQSRLPSYLTQDPYPFMPELAQYLGEAWGRCHPQATSARHG